MPGWLLSKPSEVQVGIHLLDVTKFDLKEGTHKLDFYLVLRPNRTSYKDAIEFINGETSLYDKLEDKPKSRVYRTKAEFKETVDFHWYPFMKHQLTLLLEDKHNDVEDTVFVASSEDIYLDKRVSIPGWIVSRASARSQTHYYPIFDETFSQYVFSLHIAKTFLSSVLDDIMPSLLIVLSGLLPILISPRYLAERIAITVAALLSIILLHQTAKANLPALGYLTYLDKYSVVNYALLVAALGESIWVFKISNEQGRTLARVLDIRAGGFLLLGWILLQGIVVLTM